MCGLLSITTPVALLVKEFRCSKRIAQAMSLAAVNQILCNSLGYEQLQKSKDSLKDCFENVNIIKMNLLNLAVIVTFKALATLSEHIVPAMLPLFAERMIYMY